MFPPTGGGNVTGATSCISSGQLNRAAALSDDDLDPEYQPVPSAPPSMG